MENVEDIERKEDFQNFEVGIVEVDEMDLENFEFETVVEVDEIGFQNFETGAIEEGGGRFGLFTKFDICIYPYGYLNV